MRQDKNHAVRVELNSHYRDTDCKTDWANLARGQVTDTDDVARDIDILNFTRIPFQLQHK